MMVISQLISFSQRVEIDPTTNELGATEFTSECLCTERDGYFKVKGALDADSVRSVSQSRVG